MTSPQNDSTRATPTTATPASWTSISPSGWARGSPCRRCQPASIIPNDGEGTSPTCAASAGRRTPFATSPPTSRTAAIDSPTFQRRGGTRKGAAATTATAGIALTCVLFGLQMLASRWWLDRFRFGPAEWFWRSLAYGERQPLRLTESPRR